MTVALLAGVLVSTLTPGSAAAAVVNTGSCVDGGGVSWRSRVTWGAVYAAADGSTHVQVDYAGWTTTRTGSVPSDTRVSTFDAAGRMLQSLVRTRAFDYHSGTTFDARNPVNPPSAPGRTRITVSTGVDGDGHGSCTATFVQPNLGPVPSGSVSKILTIVEENHSVTQMKAGMPYLYALAHHLTAIRHPSLPNYLAIVGGSTFGVTDDGQPASHPITGKTVFGQALENGRTARTYAESMPTSCALTGNTTRGYAVKHNPWAYFTEERADCRRYDVPETGFRAAAGYDQLPNVGLLIPNRCSDAHDCPLSTADAWLRSRLPSALSSADFTSGRLAIVITADEDDSRGDNTVLTVVLHRSLDGTHRVVSSPLSHYSVSRMYSQSVGAAPLRQAAGAPDLAAAFGLSVGPR
jgi:hypothetical protein